MVPNLHETWHCMLTIFFLLFPAVVVEGLTFGDPERNQLIGTNDLNTCVICRRLLLVSMIEIKSVCVSSSALCARTSSNLLVF